MYNFNSLMKHFMYMILIKGNRHISIILFKPFNVYKYLIISTTTSQLQGAFAGGLCGIALNMWIALGSFLYGNKAPLSKPVSTSGCLQNVTVLLDRNRTFSDDNLYSTIAYQPSNTSWNEATTHYAQ